MALNNRLYFVVGKFESYPFNEDNKEPFEGVENAVEIALIEMLLELWKEFS